MNDGKGKRVPCDRGRGSRDRERGSRDRERWSRDRERGSRDRERWSRDRDLGSRDREREPRDRERGSRDREREPRDRERDRDRRNRDQRSERDRDRDRIDGKSERDRSRRERERDCYRDDSENRSQDGDRRRGSRERDRYSRDVAGDRQSSTRRRDDDRYQRRSPAYSDYSGGGGDLPEHDDDYDDDDVTTGEQIPVLGARSKKKDDVRKIETIGTKRPTGGVTTKSGYHSPDEVDDDVTSFSTSAQQQSKPDAVDEQKRLYEEYLATLRGGTAAQPAPVAGPATGSQVFSQGHHQQGHLRGPNDNASAYNAYLQTVGDGGSVVSQQRSIGYDRSLQGQNIDQGQNLCQGQSQGQGQSQTVPVSNVAKAATSQSHSDDDMELSPVEDSVIEELPRTAVSKNTSSATPRPATPSSGGSDAQAAAAEEQVKGNIASMLRSFLPGGAQQQQPAAATGDHRAGDHTIANQPGPATGSSQAPATADDSKVSQELLAKRLTQALIQTKLLKTLAEQYHKPAADEAASSAPAASSRPLLGAAPPPQARQPMDRRPLMERPYPEDRMAPSVSSYELVQLYVMVYYYCTYTCTAFTTDM